MGKLVLQPNPKFKGAVEIPRAGENPPVPPDAASAFPIGPAAAPPSFPPTSPRPTLVPRTIPPRDRASASSDETALRRIEKHLPAVPFRQN